MISMEFISLKTKLNAANEKYKSKQNYYYKTTTMAKHKSFTYEFISWLKFYAALFYNLLFIHVCGFASNFEFVLTP